MKRWSPIVILMFYFGTVGEVISRESQCPEVWFALTLPQQIKQCRIFGVKKPATLSFFAVDSPQNIARFFEANHVNATSKTAEQFTHIQLFQPKFNLFIYADGDGTQVNIRAER